MKVRTVSNLSEVKMLVKKENPPMQKLIVKSLNTSLATLDKIVNQDYNYLKKLKII